MPKPQSPNLDDPNQQIPDSEISENPIHDSEIRENPIHQNQIRDFEISENPIQAKNGMQIWMPVFAVLAILISAFGGEVFYFITGVPFLPSILWLTAFGLYGFCISSAAEGDAEDLNQLGEHYYFVGYIATITGLGCVLFGLSRNEETESLLALGATSLLCTIIGLIGMNGLRAKAFQIERAARQNDTQKDAYRFDVFVKQISQNFESFGRRMEHLEATRMDQFSQLMNASDLAQTLKDLIGDISAGNKGLERLQKVSSDAIQSVHKVSLEFGGIGKKMVNLNKRIDSITSNAEKMSVNWERIALNSEKVQTFTERLDEASKAAESLGSSAQNANLQVSQLSDVIDETKRNTQSWQTQTAQAHEMMSDFLDVLIDLCRRLENAAKTEIKDFTSAFSKASHNLQSSTKRVDDFLMKMGENADKMAGFSGSLNEAMDQTKLTSKSFEDFKTTLAESVTSMKESIEILKNHFDNLHTEISQTQEKTKILQTQTQNAHHEFHEFGNTFRKVCDELQNTTGTVSGFVSRLNERLSNENWNAKLAGDFLDDFKKRMQETSSQMNPMADSFDEMSMKLRETTDALERFTKHLNTEKKGGLSGIRRIFGK